MSVSEKNRGSESYGHVRNYFLTPSLMKLLHFILFHTDYRSHQYSILVDLVYSRTFYCVRHQINYTVSALHFKATALTAFGKQIQIQMILIINKRNSLKKKRVSRFLLFFILQGEGGGRGGACMEQVFKYEHKQIDGRRQNNRQTDRVSCREAPEDKRMYILCT